MEIGRILHLKTENRNFKLDVPCLIRLVQFEISVFGFQMQDSSNFHFFDSLLSYVVQNVVVNPIRTVREAPGEMFVLLSALM
jgi:hypothetical protein